MRGFLLLLAAKQPSHRVIRNPANGRALMHAAAARYLPTLRNYLRQIVPPVLATLIAALLIAGFNRAFSGHLVQPRMAALHANASGDDETRTVVKTREIPAAEVAAVTEPTAPERIFAKDNDREAGKDQTAVKVAVAAPLPMPASAAAPVQAAVPAAAPIVATPTAPVTVPATPRVVQRPVEPPRVVTAPLATQPVPVVVAAPLATQPTYPPVTPMMQQPMAQQPVVQQPVAQEPPPVIAAKPMVTVPDRPRAGYLEPAPPQQMAEQEALPPAPPRPFERFVDSMKPSSIFSRMREFGDKIEAAGNDILPTIRQ
jgi:hypothetical protein